MKDTFLDNVAQKMLEAKQPLQHIQIVFPNRRAIVFFQKHLVKRLSKTQFLPNMSSLEDFVSKKTRLTLSDHITLMFELYETYKIIMKGQQQPFNDFMKYGNTILHDFNELDFYLIPHQEAFNFLKHYSKLNIWDVEQKHMSEYQKKYIHLYASLAEYYTVFKQRLLQHQTAYQGLMFRTFYDNIKELTENERFSKIYFVGFNALTPAEQRIIEFYEKSGKGEVIWNADEYYLKDKKHEAGFYLRKHFERRTPFQSFVSNHLLSDTKDISVYACAGNITQVKVAGQILSELAPDEMQDTALVLSDESLLEPLFYALPDNIPHFNITMGLPLEKTSLYNLFAACYTLQKHAKVFTYNTTTYKKYYFKHLRNVLSNPILLQLFGEESEEKIATPHLLMNRSNRIYYSQENIFDLLEKMGVKNPMKYQFLFEDWMNETEKMMFTFQSIVERILQSLEDEKAKLQQEYAYRFHNIFINIKKYNKTYKAIHNVDVLWHVFNQLASKETINFRGEPLQGLQIMGLLETRLLDFKRIILLSVNENTLPGKRDDITFFPFEMRQYYHLPMKYDQAAIYAYHFYSMLHRADDIHLIYNNLTEGMSSGEESRFIKQIRYELQVSNPNISFHEHIISAKLPKNNDFPILVRKTAELQDLLVKKAEKGFSATSLNNYRACTLRFYFEEILKVKEAEKVNETPEARMIGNLIHECLETLNNDYVKGKIINLDLLQQMAKKAPKLLKQKFDDFFRNDDMINGKNHLIYNLMEYWLKTFFEKEMGFVKEMNELGFHYQYLESEKDIRFKKTFLINGTEMSILFKGFIDRIDSVNGKHRIIDYKTGRVEPYDIKFTDIDKLLENSEKKIAFQLIFYKWLYVNETNIPYNSFDAGVVSFPKLGEGVMPFAITKHTDTDLEVFEDYLIHLMNEIFDADIPFCRTENKKHCSYCRFATICWK